MVVCRISLVFIKGPGNYPPETTRGFRKIPETTTVAEKTGPQSARVTEDRPVPAGDPILVLLQPEDPGTVKNSGPVVIFAPSFHRTALHYADLAKKIGPDITVYSFIWPEVTAKNPPADTMDAISGRFLQELRACNIHGPWILGGYCFGAVIALDMAARLAGSGEEVSLLVLIDPILPASGNEQYTLTTRLKNRIRFYRKEGIGLFFRFQYRKMRHWLHLLRATPRQRQEHRIGAAHHRAFYQYRARPYPGPAVIAFGDAEKKRSSAEYHSRDCERWKRIFSGDLEIALLPGYDHHSILTAGPEEVVQRIHTVINTGPVLRSDSEKNPNA
jgi:thioesterase domain-containing protein